MAADPADNTCPVAGDIVLGGTVPEDRTGLVVVGMDSGCRRRRSNRLRRLVRESRFGSTAAFAAGDSRRIRLGAREVAIGGRRVVALRAGRISVMPLRWEGFFWFGERGE